jgi:hypothetical protein
MGNRTRAVKSSEGGSHRGPDSEVGGRARTALRRGFNTLGYPIDMACLEETLIGQMNAMDPPIS